MWLRQIEAILLEPVGCLAEFPPEPFHEIAVRFFGRRGKASKSGSRSYWHLLTLMEAKQLSDADNSAAQALEIEAAAAASMYEDVVPALAELKAMGVPLWIASSLSSAAVSRFVTSNGMVGFFSRICTR